MEHIRSATAQDAVRMAEIEVFNYRLNFYPIFQSDGFYFDELQVPKLAEEYKQKDELLKNSFVYDDGVVKAFIRIKGEQVEKLFVEPVLQSSGIGAKLLEFAKAEQGVRFLWALEKNEKAIRFYERHGFRLTEERQLEDDTTEYLVKMQR